MDSERNSKTAIFIMPRSSRSWKGSEALWITAAGWASAAKRKFGDAMVITSDRIAKPEEVWNYPLVQKKEKPGTKKKFVFVPSFFRIIFKDLLVWRNLQNWKSLENGIDKVEKIVFVWEKHDLFFGPGKKLSRKFNVPLISYVHAPVVWEASKWGVQRYFWGKWLEKIEVRNLKKADLVAVVSEEVKTKIVSMGIPEDKILISPMGVEPQLFTDNVLAVSKLKEKFNLEKKFIIGWTGSFRKFHGLDHVIRAFKGILNYYPEAVLMLIGDGAEREDSEMLVEKLGIRDKVIFTGRLQFLEIPKYVALFDIAIVSARSTEDFHYSPLKLREYMAAGKAVLAPNAGEIPYTFHDEENVKLFNAGNIKDLEKGIRYLITNKEKRREIAENGKKLILETGTWEKELDKAMKSLNI